MVDREVERVRDGDFDWDGEVLKELDWVDETVAETERELMEAEGEREVIGELEGE